MKGFVQTFNFHIAESDSVETEEEEEDVMLSTTVTLTDAQIKALPTTPIEVLAAPGANKLIVPFVVVLRLNWFADYTNISADAHLKVDTAGTFVAALHEANFGTLSLLLAGGGPDGSIATLALNQLASSVLTSATPSTVPHDHQGAGDAGWYDSDIVNMPLKIQIENSGGGNLTGGHASNTLSITVFYAVVEF